MKVYAPMEGKNHRYSLHDAIPYFRRIEALGYDGVHVTETIHDPYAVATLAAEHTTNLTVRTAVALAFPRSPTATAYAAWDIARFSGGRLQLGLGTQIRQNIEGRYGMPWGEPVARLREYVEALHAVYRSFQTGDPPEYTGRYYRITRMQPYFNPGPDPTTQPPPTWLGGVNPQICQLTGELAAGFVTHPTNSGRRYLEEICFPNIAEGAARAGRTLNDIEIVINTEVASGSTADELAVERARQREMLAFLYSTPAYGRTLELHGWDDLGKRLRALIREERWTDLQTVIPDDILETLIPTALYEDLADLVIDRYADIADGITIHPPENPADDGRFGEVVKVLQAAPSRRPRVSCS